MGSLISSILQDTKPEVSFLRMPETGRVGVTSRPQALQDYANSLLLYMITFMLFKEPHQ